jgi:hypothetical protein
MDFSFCYSPLPVRERFDRPKARPNLMEPTPSRQPGGNDGKSLTAAKQRQAKPSYSK